MIELQRLGAIMRFSLLIFIYIYSLAIHSTALADDWDKALSQAGLKKSDIHFREADLALFNRMDFVPAHFWNLMKDPLGIPSYVRIQKNRMYGKAKNIDHTLLQTLSRLGHGPRRNLIGDPNAGLLKAAEKPGALSKVITRLSGKSAGKASKVLSKDGQKWLAYLMLVIEKAGKDRKAAFKKVPASLMRTSAKEIIDSQKHSNDVFQPLSKNLIKLSKLVDYQQFFVGATDLSIALEKVKDEFGKLSDEPAVYFRAETSNGAIVIDTRKKASTHKGPFLFLLDSHGNDKYIAGTNKVGATSVIIDLQGNDKYLAFADLEKTEVKSYKNRKSKKRTGFASGFFGYSFLLDFDGSDLYRSLSFTQGSGVFGVGMLWDFKGDDIYDCYNFCQAAAYFGAGILVDAHGKDHYTGFRKLQSYSGTMGASSLYDWGDGGDQYLAHNSPLDFPSYYDKAVNTSYAQAASVGYRADYIDRNSWGGGFAVLLDAGGNNTFQAGVYSQATSYWYSTGLLFSGAGNDTFESTKYSIAAGVHYGVGVLDDAGGNDKYKVTQELGIGAGHDFAIGFLIDHAGDDQYEAINLGIGGGSANGFGFFWDMKGNDRYTSKQHDVFGSAIDRTSKHSIRNRNRTIGVMIDSNGKDNFISPKEGFSGKIRNKKWYQKPRTAVIPKFTEEYYIGVGALTQSETKEFPDGFPYDSKIF